MKRTQMDRREPPCPNGHTVSRIIETGAHYGAVYRRRLCNVCAARFSTIEINAGSEGVAKLASKVERGRKA